MARVALTDDNGALYGAPATWLNNTVNAVVGVEPPTAITFSDTQPVSGGFTAALTPTSPVTWTSAKPLQSSGYVSSAIGVADIGVAFTVWGRTAAIRVYCRSSSTTVRVEVDGRLATTREGLPVPGAANTGLKWVLIQFDTIGPHHVKVAGKDAAWAAYAHDANGAISPAPEVASAIRMLVLGDSWVAGALGISSMNTWPSKLGGHLGIPEPWNAGQGGTGYVNTGPGSDDWTQDFGDARRLDKIIAAKPTDVVVFGTINDDASTPATVKANAKALYAALVNALPAVRIHVALPQTTSAASDASAARTNNRIAVRSAAQESNRIFTVIDSVGDGWFTAGNRSLFLGSDGVHPTQAGHDYIAARMAEYLRDSLTSTAKPLPMLITYAADEFTRADGPAGITETGGLTWTALKDNPWTISGNKLVPPAAFASTGIGARMAVDVGVTNFEAEAYFSGSNWGMGVLFRADATGAGYVLQNNNNTVELVLADAAGAGTVIKVWSPGAATEYTLKVRCVGTTITCYRNGVELGSHTDATYAGTRVGVRANGSGTRAADNFKVTSIPG